MAAITITRGRMVDLPGNKVFRGVGAFNSTDTSGTLQVPKGNIIGFNAHACFASATAVAFAIDGTPTNGVLSPAADGTITIKRSAGTDSGGTFFFEVEYDSK